MICEAGLEGCPTKHHTGSRGTGADRSPDCNQGVHRPAEEERVVFGHTHPVRTHAPKGPGRMNVCPDVVRTTEPANPNRLTLLERINGTPKRSHAARRADESERVQGSRGDAPNNIIDPHRVVAENPRELASAIRMPAQGSTPSVPPATKESAKTVIEPAKGIDAMSSAEARSTPTSYLSRAPVASADDMNIDQPANPPENALSGGSDHQTVARIDQEKIDPAAKHRTVLKEIWERRIL